MDTAEYVEKISALLNRIMLGPFEFKLPAEAEDLDLTHSQFQGLAYLLRHGHTSVGELADGLSISHPAAVKMVDRLRKKALVTREESEQDRRVSRVALTKMGRNIVESAVAERLSILAKATEQMGNKELEGLLRGLEALLSAALATPTIIEKACLRCGINHIGCCPVNRAHAALTGAVIRKT